jgi:thiopeptide-type bacteriocin biosynthesis protein
MTDDAAISGAASDAAPPSAGIEIARVGAARWASFHVFCPTDRDGLLMQVIQPVVAEVWADGLADRFFFIRYPEGGDHIRLRLRIAAEIDTAAAVDRAFALLCARCAELQRSRRDTPDERISVVPAIFELEIDRYGGPRWFPAALSFFALSSVAALRFVAAWRGAPRGRQLVEILGRLARQAIGMARTVEELRGLADYDVQRRPGMAPIIARAGQMFERTGPELTHKIRELFAAARSTIAAPGSPEAHMAHARSLSTALAGLEPEPRWRVLGSQMHMTANRLGLSVPEETYLSTLLCRCLDAIGDELGALVATAAAPAVPLGELVATAAAPAVPLGAVAPDAGGLPVSAPAAPDVLDPLISAELRALFSDADAAADLAPEGAT